MTGVDYAFLTIAIWNIICALILERRVSNVKCVDCALHIVAVWTVICAFILGRSRSYVTCVDYALLKIALWNVICAFILGRSPSNVTCVNYAFLRIAVWNVICALILERNLSNVTCVNYAFLTITVWNVICALILDIWLVWFNSKSKLETAFVFSSTVEKPFKCDVYQVRLSRSDTLKTHTRIHIQKTPSNVTSMCVLCFSKNMHLKTHQIRFCALILGRNSSNLTDCSFLKIDV